MLHTNFQAKKASAVDQAHVVPPAASFSTATPASAALGVTCATEMQVCEPVKQAINIESKQKEKENKSVSEPADKAINEKNMQKAKGEKSASEPSEQVINEENMEKEDEEKSVSKSAIQTINNESIEKEKEEEPVSVPIEMTWDMLE